LAPSIYKGVIVYQQAIVFSKKKLLGIGVALIGGGKIASRCAVKIR
jgi:hypothetical protein